MSLAEGSWSSSPIRCSSSLVLSPGRVCWGDNWSRIHLEQHKNLHELPVGHLLPLHDSQKRQHCQAQSRPGCPGRPGQTPPDVHAGLEIAPLPGSAGGEQQGPTHSRGGFAQPV